MLCASGFSPVPLSLGLVMDKVMTNPGPLLIRGLSHLDNISIFCFLSSLEPSTLPLYIPSSPAFSISTSAVSLSSPSLFITYTYFGLFLCLTPSTSPNISLYFIPFPYISLPFFFLSLSPHLSLSLPGLPQDHQATDGHGVDQEAPGEQLLLQRQRVYPGLQHHVHQLLHLQQGTKTHLLRLAVGNGSVCRFISCSLTPKIH